MKARMRTYPADIVRGRDRVGRNSRAGIVARSDWQTERHFPGLLRVGHRMDIRHDRSLRVPGPEELPVTIRLSRFRGLVKSDGALLRD